MGMILEIATLLLACILTQADVIRPCERFTEIPATGENSGTDGKPRYTMVRYENFDHITYIVESNTGTFRGVAAMLVHDAPGCNAVQIVTTDDDDAVSLPNCPGTISSRASHRKQFTFMITVPQCGCLTIRASVVGVDRKVYRDRNDIDLGPLTDTICPAASDYDSNPDNAGKYADFEDPDMVTEHGDNENKDELDTNINEDSDGSDISLIGDRCCKIGEEFGRSFHGRGGRMAKKPRRSYHERGGGMAEESGRDGRKRGRWIGRRIADCLAIVDMEVDKLYSSHTKLRQTCVISYKKCCFRPKKARSYLKKEKEVLMVDEGTELESLSSWSDGIERKSKDVQRVATSIGHWPTWGNWNRESTGNEARSTGGYWNRKTNLEYWSTLKNKKADHKSDESSYWKPEKKSNEDNKEKSVDYHKESESQSNDDNDWTTEEDIVDDDKETESQSNDENNWTPEEGSVDYDKEVESQSNDGNDWTPEEDIVDYDKDTESQSNDDNDWTPDEESVDYDKEVESQSNDGNDWTPEEGSVDYDKKVESQSNDGNDWTPEEGSVDYDKEVESQSNDGNDWTPEEGSVEYDKEVESQSNDGNDWTPEEDIVDDDKEAESQSNDDNDWTPDEESVDDDKDTESQTYENNDDKELFDYLNMDLENGFTDKNSASDRFYYVTEFETIQFTILQKLQDEISEIQTILEKTEEVFDGL